MDMDRWQQSTASVLVNSSWHKVVGKCWHDGVSGQRCRMACRQCRRTSSVRVRDLRSLKPTDILLYLCPVAASLNEINYVSFCFWFYFNFYFWIILDWQSNTRLTIAFEWASVQWTSLPHLNRHKTPTVLASYQWSAKLADQSLLWFGHLPSWTTQKALQTPAPQECLGKFLGNHRKLKKDGTGFHPH